MAGKTIKERNEAQRLRQIKVRQAAKSQRRPDRDDLARGDLGIRNRLFYVANNISFVFGSLSRFAAGLSKLRLRGLKLR